MERLGDWAMGFAKGMNDVNPLDLARRLKVRPDEA
jgi:hypothetical protein